MKTFRLLKRDQADRARIEKVFSKKSDQVLLGAIANPEHSEAAVQILRELADQRGLHDRVEAHWAQTGESMYVAPFGKQPTLEEVLAAPGRRRKVYRSLQVIMLACLAAGLFAFQQDVQFAYDIGLAFFVGGILLWLIGGIFSWTRPCRILLLRPFQSKKVSRPLKRFMTKNVSFYGHTITLADKYLKESWLYFMVFWIPRSIPEIFVLILFIFPPIRQFKRWIKVGSSSSYLFLKKRLARRFTMNMFWQNTFSGDKLLKVKCSDTWWKQCVDLLMYSSQLIIVDLSWVKVGTEWELDKINSRDLEGKTVFIVGEEAADYAREVVEKFWPFEEAPPPLHVYKTSGKLLDSEAYRQDVARIISESHLWHGVSAEPA